MSTKRRTPGVFASPTPRNEKGERLCRNCKSVMPKSARNNCSSKCSEEWSQKTSPAIMRHAIRNRDRGICAICRVDTIAQATEYLKLHTMEEREKFRKMAGVPAGRAGGAEWWDADHIVPVVEGGGECGLEGYRTLCIPCHKSVTRELRKRLADQHREQRAIEKDAQRGLLEGMTV